MMKWKLSEVVLSVLVLGVGGVLLTLLILGSRTHSNVTACAGNLNQLATAMYNYSITNMEPDGAFPTKPLGGRWWLILYEHREIEDASLFWCPVFGVSLKWGETNYRGPGTNPNLLDAGGPLGCCRPGNHGDEPDTTMTWVEKSGDVHMVSADSDEWKKILAQTKD